MAYELSFLEMVFFNMNYMNMTKDEAEQEAHAVINRRAKRDAEICEDDED